MALYSGAVGGDYTPRRVIGVYMATGLLFALAASLIWAINTIFLLDAGLDIFQVMLVNTSFTLSQMLFEVPTGVVADTIGRKASLLISYAVLVGSTALYVLTPQMGWGIPGFMVASVLIGLGFCFQTGAVDAWLVDALDATGWERPKERVFAWGQMTFGSGMLIGTLTGGFLGQVDLTWPYIVRAVLLVLAFVVALVFMKDVGFEPRPLKMRNFGEETRTIFRAGTRYGWHHPVVRPLMFVSGLTGIFFIYGFYAWQPYVLELLGRNAIWTLGVIQATSSLAGIAGNSLVGRVMREGESRRSPSAVLAGVTVLMALAIALIGTIGLVFAGTPGLAPFLLASILWVSFNMFFGVLGPVRQAYINDFIPSAQRATVLSLDALFADAGGSIGQPALGWIARRAGYPLAWFISAAFLGAGSLFYRRAGRAQAELEAAAA